MGAPSFPVTRSPPKWEKLDPGLLCCLNDEVGLSADSIALGVFLVFLFADVDQSQFFDVSGLGALKPRSASVHEPCTNIKLAGA